MSLIKNSIAALGLASALIAAAPSIAADADHKAEWSKIKILFVPWSQSSNSFFEAVVNGAKDAAAQQGVQLEVQFGEEDQNRTKTILETGIANKVSGIAVNIADDDAFDDVLRHAGVKKAMDEIGATTEVLGTGNDHAQALDKMTQYLLGHPDTKAVIGLGQTPTSQAVQAIKDAKLKIPAGGFDVSKSILDDIKEGRLTATVDQQPYSQGFYAVTQLALNIKYGLYPSEMNTGGDGLIDKSNYKYAEKWAGPVR